MVDYTLIKEMFKLQDTFNEYTVTNWKEANLPWHRAIWLECAEAVESLDWKWWKHGTDDLDNLKVELVDIWHFLMSYNIVRMPPIAENPENFPHLFEVKEVPSDIDLKDMFDDFVGLLLEKETEETAADKQFLTFIFLNMWAKIGYSVNDLYREYVIKNALNKTRQDNGYKTGEYVKMWFYEGNIVEDNVVAWKLAEDIDVSENMFDELYKALNAYYSAMPKTKSA